MSEPFQFLNCARKSSLFYVFIPTSHLSSCCGRCFYPCRCHLYIFFSSSTFQSFCRSPNLTHLPLHPEDQSTLCIVALSGLRHPSPFLMLYLQLFLTTRILTFESKVWRKDYRREVTDKRTRKVFFVNSNLSPALIGTLATAVRVINKTIELERWGLVLPTTDRALQLPCESWSRKWIVISFYGHKRLL